MGAAGKENVKGFKLSMNHTGNQLVLELDNVKKIFSQGTVDEVIALSNIDVKVYSKEFVTIIGSNGAGKSTMLNIVAGVFPPEKGGKVVINGADITNLAEYKHAAYVGRVWQQPGVGTARNLTIEENMAMAFMRGRPRRLRMAINKQRRKKFRDSLEPLGLALEMRLNQIVGTLSGGQRQALSLVMATISKPAILLLDEHIATLDPKTAQTVMEMTDMVIKKENMTAMMVTHNMDMALRYGNRLIMLHKGRILVDIGEEDKKSLTINDLVSAFERAAGEKFSDDNILLRQE